MLPNDTHPYCEYCNQPSTDKYHHLHKYYHDHHYGVQVPNDTELFARLILEINQAGLSWTTILTKWENFYHAYDQFNIAKVATYRDKDIQRLLGDAGIIRNKLKIGAAIHNAQEIVRIQEQHGSFAGWIQMHAYHQPTLLEWQKIFKKQGFKFTGGEILREFLVSTGYIEGAHGINCQFYKRQYSAMIYILPTDTCYGLAGSCDEASYQEIYRIKHRDLSKPLAVLVRNFDDLSNYVEISKEQIKALKAYPHPWSCIARRQITAPLPEIILTDSKYQKLSLRVAEVCISENIRNNIPYPLFLTSANHSGEKEAHTLEDAKNIVNNLDIEVGSFDGGICNKPGSNIFEFDEGSDEKTYLRRNYF